MKSFTNYLLKRSLACLAAVMLLFNAVNGQITITEVNYHSDTTLFSGEWVELYNYGTAPVDLSSWIFSDSQSIHYFTIPGGTVLMPGAYLVLSNDTVRFRQQYPSVNNIIGQFNFGLGNKGDVLRLFDAQSNLLLSMTYADSAGWPKAADGHGRTLEVRNSQGNINDPSNWYAGCMGGSPGAAPSPCSEPIIFTEVNYHSDPSTDVKDWVELYNRSSQAIDISNWILRDKNDSSSFYIQQGTVLGPGEYLVLSGGLGYFMQYFPGATNVQGDFMFGLKNSKDVVRLFNSQGTLVYSLAYRSDGYWPTEPDGGGYTLELLDQNGIMNDGQNWFAGCYGGSPGRGYSPACDMLSVGSHGNEAGIEVYPNPFIYEAMIKIANVKSEGDITVSITDALGREVKRITAAAQGSASIIVQRRDMSSGIYFYAVKDAVSCLGSGKLVIED